MPPPFVIVFDQRTPTYTVLVSTAILLALVIGLRGLRHRRYPGPVLDVLLAGLGGGLLLARLEHVLLHWGYFRDHESAILNVQAGGLGWHGAVIGALLGLWMAARLRRIEAGHLLALMAPALPLLAFFAWWGCGANHCAYGAEVPTLAAHPDWLVWEAPDIFNLSAPRYRTQQLGMLLAASLLMLWWPLARRDAFRMEPARRLWLLLLLLSAGMFGLGFLRGDEVLAAGGLRGDQWLDLFTAALAALLLGFGRFSRPSPR